MNAHKKIISSLIVAVLMLALGMAISYGSFDAIAEFSTGIAGPNQTMLRTALLAVAALLLAASIVFYFYRESHRPRHDPSRGTLHLWETVERVQAEKRMQPAVPMADLPPIVGDHDGAADLRSILSRKPLYVSRLRKFVAGQKAAPVDIGRALEDNDWDKAEWLTGALKDVCGRIGARRLQLLAGKLETAITRRRPREELAAHLVALEQPLNYLVAELELHLPHEAETQVMNVDRARLAAVCEQLKMLLIYGDPVVRDVLDANMELIDAGLPDHAHKLEQQIHAADYVAALGTLRAARAVSLPRELA